MKTPLARPLVAGGKMSAMTLWPIVETVVTDGGQGRRSSRDWRRKGEAVWLGVDPQLGSIRVR